MKHLIVGLIIIVSCCVVIKAQGKDKAGLLPNIAALDSQDSNKPAGTEPSWQAVSELINNLSQDQPTDWRGFFTVANGSVYQRLMGGRFLIAMPGGGASGCFSLDLPQRISDLKEFTHRLESLKRNSPQVY